MLNSGANRLRAELLALIDTQLGNASGQRHNPYWTSSTGYNLKSWEVEGYSACRSLLYAAKPRALESAWSYADRLLKQLEALKNVYRESSADEDGGGVGAVGSVILELERRRWASAGSSR